DGDGWARVQSMNDLQWHLTQAALRGEDLRVQVQRRTSAAQAPDGERELRFPLSQVDASQVDGQLMERIGLTGPYTDPVIDRVVEGGPAALAGLRSGDWVLSIDGIQPRDASQLFKAIRGGHNDGQPRPILMRVQRGSQVLDLTIMPVMKDVGGQRVPRIEASLGGELARVEVSYGFFEGLKLAVAKTWDVSVLSLKMLGRMLIG